MASSQSPSRVFFTNFDRSVNDKNTDFSISFDTPIQNAQNFEVVSASFPNLFKNFAPYETILYFYHSAYQGGMVAIGVPLSTTLVGGTGDATTVTGREAFIDKRYFFSGLDLASYLTNWFASLSATYPTAGSGLQPFSYADDNPANPPTLFATQASTSVTFSNISFTFDDNNSFGTMKIKATDSSGATIRIASILDFGSLSSGYALPSQLSFKLGYTDFDYQAFSASGLIAVRSPNNVIGVGCGDSNYQQTMIVPPNDYTQTALADMMTSLVANLGVGSQYGNTISFFWSSGLTRFNVNQTGGGSFRGFYMKPISGNTFYSQLGLTFAGFEMSTAGGTFNFPNAPVTITNTPTPAYHLAKDTINLIRTSSIYFASSLSSGESLASGGRKDVLFKTTLNSGIGSVQTYQSSLQGIVMNHPPSAIRTVRVTLLDDNYQVMEELPQNAPITIEVHFSYDEGKRINELESASLNPYA